MERTAEEVLEMNRPVPDHEEGETFKDLFELLSYHRSEMDRHAKIHETLSAAYLKLRNWS